MQLLVSITIFFIISACISYGSVEGHQATFYIHNKCPFPIWPATAPNTGQPIIADGGFYLPSSQTKKIIAPWSWSGRIWARTGCNFASNNWKPSCETGDCDGKLACNGAIGTPPATLVEITLQGDKGKPNFYDVSLVNGYNIPVSVVIPNKDINSKCNIQGMVMEVLRSDACPNYFSYAFDTPSPLVSCGSLEYIITFCPYGWGGATSVPTTQIEGVSDV
ncbi:hypothetical protein P8452_54563 [Trifolium repens]|nr:hypothetical protein P8452_54563 [Trifolium repens]